MGVDSRNHKGLKEAHALSCFDRRVGSESFRCAQLRPRCLQSHSPPPGDPYLALHRIIFYDDKFHHKSHLQMAI